MGEELQNSLPTNDLAANYLPTNPLVSPYKSRRRFLQGVLARAAMMVGTAVVAGAVGFPGEVAALGTSPGTANSSTTEGSTLIVKRRYAADYTIYTDGPLVKAENATTAAVDYSGAEPGAVVQSCITALASTGGTILLREGTYVWGSIPAFPRNIPNWLRIIGEAGTIIQLSSAAPRAFDVATKIADEDMYQNIWLEGFTVDCNNTMGKHHVVLGNYISGKNQYHIQWNNITIKEIKTINVPTDPTVLDHPNTLGTSHRMNVDISTRHGGSAEALDTITNILIQDCDFQGGNYGIAVNSVGWSGSAYNGNNVWLDNIQIIRCRHDTLIVPTTIFTSAHFHVGNDGTGGLCIISGCQGSGSGDVGVEVDGMNETTVENCTMHDVANHSFYPMTFRPLTDPARWVNTFRDCHVYNTNLTAGSATPGHGFSVGSGPNQKGTVILEDCSYFAKGASVNGQAVRMFNTDVSPGLIPLRRLVIDNFNANFEGITNPSGTNYLYGVHLFFAAGTGFATLPELIINGLNERFEGTMAGGSLYTYSLGVAGTVDVTVDGFECDNTILGQSAGLCRFVELGAAGGAFVSSINAVIESMRITGQSDDTAPKGIYIRKSSNLTVPNQIRIEDCDFSLLPSGAREIAFETANQNNSKIVFGSGNIWKQGTPLGTISKPFDNTNYLIGETVSSGGAGPTAASTDYTIINGDYWIDVTGGTAVDVTLKDNAGTTISPLGATPARFLVPLNGKVNFGAFSVAPTVTATPRF